MAYRMAPLPLTSDL